MAYGVSSEKTCCRLCTYVIASFKDVDSVNVVSVDDGGTENSSENLS